VNDRPQINTNTDADYVTRGFILTSSEAVVKPLRVPVEQGAMMLETAMHALVRGYFSALSNVAKRIRF
jgi:hypothetical protein|tara:strand:+ start:352 stop:555 length:204 start_codon:yes stop_codon:yes gene_type:complete